MASLYDFNAITIDGKDRSLADFKGKAILVVNTASQCGLTPQYTGLQELYASHHDKGLEILGFPCDQFGHQEPGDEAEIATFCTKNYGVTFPMFSKIDVNGPNEHPVFAFLKKQTSSPLGSKIKWNFTKFLVDADGKPIKRFAPTTKPSKLTADVEKLLAR